MIRFFGKVPTKIIFNQSTSILVSNSKSNIPKNRFEASNHKMSTNEILQKAMTKKLFDPRYQTLKPIQYSSIKETLDQSSERFKHSKY